MHPSDKLCICAMDDGAREVGQFKSFGAQKSMSASSMSGTELFYTFVVGCFCCCLDFLFLFCCCCSDCNYILVLFLK